MHSRQLEYDSLHNIRDLAEEETERLRSRYLAASFAPGITDMERKK